MTHDLQNIPTHTLPDGYHFRLFGSKENDDQLWAEIVTATDEFPSVEKALQRFNSEFAPHRDEAEKRIIFLETADGHAAGTATAWFGQWNDNEIGRLHWIEIFPKFQSKGLGKPLIAHAMKTLALYHQTAYLTTQQTSPAAIHIYKKFGWKPAIVSEADGLVWGEIGG